MTHETRFTIHSRFHSEDDEGLRKIELTPAESVYIIGFISNYNHMFSYLHSLKRWEMIPEEENGMKPI